MEGYRCIYIVEKTHTIHQNLSRCIRARVTTHADWSALWPMARFHCGGKCEALGKQYS